MVNLQPITKGCDRRGMFYWQMDRPFDEEETRKYFLDRGKDFDTNQAIIAIEYGLRKAGYKGDAARVSELHERATSGSVNLVYKATLKNGKQVVIRIHPPGVKNGYFWVEAKAVTLAKSKDVPVYDTIYIDDSYAVFPFDFMVMSAVPGRDMKSFGEIDAVREKTLLTEVGEYLAKIHSIKTMKYGFYDNEKAKSKGELVGIHEKWQDFVFAAYVDNLRYLVQTRVLCEKDEINIRNIFDKHRSVIKYDEPRLVQNDVADWNVMTDGNKITGIIDWDECYSGDPVCDFSTWSVFFPFERMEYLLAGYKKISKLSDGFEEKLHIYRLRYIVSKMTGRKKKLLSTKSDFIQQLLDYAVKILHDEYRWYGVKII